MPPMINMVQRRNSQALTQTHFREPDSRVLVSVASAISGLRSVQVQAVLELICSNSYLAPLEEGQVDEHPTSTSVGMIWRLESESVS